MPSPPAPADYLLMPVGSSGDVFPFVGLAERLRARGHAVTLSTSEPFREMIEEQLGFPFVGWGEHLDFDAIMADPDLWHPTRGFSALCRHAILPAMEWQIDLIRERDARSKAEGRQLRVVSAALGIGVRLGCEALGVPLTSVSLQPVVFWSEYRTPRVHSGFAGINTLGDGVPRWFKRFQYWLGQIVMLDPPLKKRVNGRRRQLGLEPVRHVDQLFHSPTRGIGLFPAWYAPPQPDWPAGVKLTDFPMWDAAGVEPMADELAAYLDAGEPPLAFTAGTAMQSGQAFFAAAADACRRLGRRGLLLTKYPDQLPTDLPDGVRHVEFAPFSQLLPRCAAFVHHGGIGSTSQALAAGVPQLVMPMSHDQPDNAWRLKDLIGVGDFLMPRKFRGPAVAKTLSRLLESTEVAAACRSAAERMNGADGLGGAVDILESDATSPGNT